MARDCYAHNSPAFKSVLRLTAFYLHLGPFTGAVIGVIKAQIALLDEGTWESPQRVAIPVAPQQGPVETTVVAASSAIIH